MFIARGTCSSAASNSNEAPATARAAAQVVARANLSTCADRLPATSLHGGFRNGSVGFLEHLAPDDQLLHLGRAFVDAQRADLAIQALDDLAARARQAAMQLHRRVDDRCADSVALILAIAASASCARLHVALPGRA